jgi:hypothetical protein
MIKRCSYCRKEIPEDSLFCHHCGERQPFKSHIPELNTYVDLSLPLLPQIREQFFLSLKVRMEREHPLIPYNTVAERIYTSGFRDELSVKFEKLAHIIDEELKMDILSIPYLNLKIEDLFENLIDLFLIRFCQDLIKDSFSSSIIGFQDLLPSEIDWSQLIYTYLEPEKSGVRCYMNFKDLNPVKIKQFTSSFLFPEPLEKIFFVADLSLLANASEGFALTDKAIYWRVPFKKERAVPYHLIKDIRIEKSWVLINNHYFNANDFLNPKILRLLSKLMRLSR